MWAWFICAFDMFGRSFVSFSSVVLVLLGLVWFGLFWFVCLLLVVCLFVCFKLCLFGIHNVYFLCALGGASSQGT